MELLPGSCDASQRQDCGRARRANRVAGPPESPSAVGDVDQLEGAGSAMPSTGWRTAPGEPRRCLWHDRSRPCRIEPDYLRGAPISTVRSDQSAIFGREHRIAQLCRSRCVLGSELVYV
jgi:hypothetical protein